LRKIFAERLTELAKENDDVVLLSGDIGNKMFDDFKEVAPNRFFNCGIAEANMIGVSAGLALNGFRPFVYTIAPFATVRCLEQIRVDLCYHNLPVVIVGTGSGLSYAELGPTHQMLEDISLLRSFPNMTIVCPCDPRETDLAISQSFKRNSPMYIRLGKKGEPVLHNHDFEIGKSNTIRDGDDVCIITTGSMLKNVLGIADTLGEKGIKAHVEHFHTVKPIDKNSLNKIFNKFKIIVTIEEHSLIGGLGSIVTETYVDGDFEKVKILRFGTDDKYLSKTGSKEYMIKEYGLDYNDIVKQVVSVCK